MDPSAPLVVDNGTGVRFRLYPSWGILSLTTLPVREGRICRL